MEAPERAASRANRKVSSHALVPANGEIDRATFARQYCHRGPQEMEISLPRPAGDPDWIDRQLAGLREAPVDVTTLLTARRTRRL